MLDIDKSRRTERAYSRLRSGFAIVFLAVAAVAWGACGSDSSNATDGGTGKKSCNPADYVYTDPDTSAEVCEGKCASCKEGNVCVANRCALTCTSLADCANFNFANGWLASTQGCKETTDDSEPPATLNVCTSNGKARGFGYTCPFGDGGCFGGPDPAFQLQACPDGRPCGDPCHGHKCLKDEDACRGVKDCKLGRCENAADFSDSSSCVYNSGNELGDLDPCPGLCQPLKCLTSGDGDADAYCTRLDCADDAGCPDGYWCGPVRRSVKSCDDKLPKYNFCGTASAEPCVDTNNPPPGTTFYAGAGCVEQKACLKRQQCDGCTTDIDCSLTPGQKCVSTGDATKVCGRGCAADGDCDPQFKCDTAQGACVPKGGKCKGTGALCDPCQYDDDCNGGVCLQPGLSQEKMCLPPSTPSCTSDNSCPLVGDMLHGECLDAGEGVPAGNPAYHTCYLPLANKAGNQAACNVACGFNANTGQYEPAGCDTCGFRCWKSNGI